MKKEIEKITVSLPKEILRLADDNRERFGFQNRSEFIQTAIKEYVSRDLLKSNLGELAELYEKIEHSEIKELESHLSKLFYKLAVEISQLNLLCASVFELSYVEAQNIRGKAVKLVNSSKGFVNLYHSSKNKVDVGF